MKIGCKQYAWMLKEVTKPKVKKQCIVMKHITLCILTEMRKNRFPLCYNNS